MTPEIPCGPCNCPPEKCLDFRRQAANPDWKATFPPTDQAGTMRDRIADLERENRQLASGRKEDLDSLVDAYMEKHRAAYVSEGNAALTALLIAQGHGAGCAESSELFECKKCGWDCSSNRECKRCGAQERPVPSRPYPCDCHLRDIPAAAKEFHLAVVELVRAARELRLRDDSEYCGPRATAMYAALDAPALRVIA
jgi:hypothetical protein